MSSNPPPKPTGNRPASKPPVKPPVGNPAASNPPASKPAPARPALGRPPLAKSTTGKPDPKATPGRRVPQEPGRRRAPKASKVIVVGIVIGFVGSAACAIAPLLFHASRWWLALSLVLLVMSALPCLALREEEK